MTTIALDKNGLLAFESRVTEGGVIVDDNYNKQLIRKGGGPKGTVRYFSAGRVTDLDLLVSAIEDGPLESYPSGVEVEAIIYMDNTFYTAGISSSEGFFIQEERLGNPVAIGSGQLCALGAMDAGANAKEAVIIACGRDVNSGGRIRTFRGQKDVSS